ncbi:MAG TPA: hypothetical protein VJ746_01515 [Nitrospira sp.]|nr:hypothetical protein [Nitrospira sp.]
MPPVSQDSFADYLQLIIAALPQPTPPYCVVGALAVNAWGRLRATKDIDLLVLSDDTARAALIDALLAHGFHADRTWMERNPMAKDVIMRLVHSSHPAIPLDLLFAHDAQSQSALARRRSLQLLGVSLWVCSPEDLILLKLKASRPHDFEDALGIVKNPHVQLDLDYLWHWADRLGLQGELQYVLDATGAGS